MASVDPTRSARLVELSVSVAELEELAAILEQAETDYERVVGEFAGPGEMARNWRETEPAYTRIGHWRQRIVEYVDTERR